MMTHRWIRAAVLGCAATLATSAFAVTSSDKDFAASATEGSLTEIEMAQLALKKTQNPEIRSMAEKMIHDHTMLIQNMKPFADAWGLKPVETLDAKHKLIYHELDMKSGADFDKAYVKAMDKDHHEDMDDFGKEINTTQDVKFKETVIKGEKVVAEHTKMWDGLAGKYGVA